MRTVPSDLKRGDVVRVRLDPVEGSEQAGDRPAVVVSPNTMNTHSPLVTIAAVTSKGTEKRYAFEVLVEPPNGGLSLRSKVMLTQIRSINKTRIIGYYGRLEDVTMQQVDQSLKIALGLK